MTTHKEALTLALDALNTNRVMAKDSEGNYTREITPKLIVEAITSIDKALAQPNEKEAALLRALEIIAVGDANNPQAQAAEELIALGYWRDIPEAIALAQPISSVEQEPVAEVVGVSMLGVNSPTGKHINALVDLPIGAKLYTTQPQRKPLTDWIDPNDKTQERFLPNIGEPVLFCHSGSTYFGKHNGGSFQCGAGVTKRYFNTWECHWMPLPAAHGIKGDA